MTWIIIETRHVCSSEDDVCKLENLSFRHNKTVYQTMLGFITFFYIFIRLSSFKWKILLSWPLRTKNLVLLSSPKQQSFILLIRISSKINGKIRKISTIKGNHRKHKFPEDFWKWLIKAIFERHNSTMSHALCHSRESIYFPFIILLGRYRTLKNKLKNHVIQKISI